MSDAFEDWAAATFVKWCNCTWPARKGQFYFNELYFNRPDIAKQIMHTKANPFYAQTATEDERLKLFLDTVHEIWSKETNNA